jgi:hypothetical protein
MAYSKQLTFFATWFVLGVFGVVILFSAPPTSAEEPNDAPIVESMFLNTGSGGYRMTSNISGESFSLAPGVDTEFHVSGVVKDYDGRDDITYVKLDFYSDGAGNNLCTANKRNCYHVTSCSTRNGATQEQKEYDCSSQIVYWANATTTGGFEAGNSWNARIEVADVLTATGSDLTTIDIDPTLSLTIPTVIDWGTLALGQATTSSETETMVVTQQGNDEADMLVNGENMTCTVFGSIPMGNIEWDMVSNDGHGGAGANALTATSTEIPVSVGYKTEEGTDPSTNIYWDIQVPDGAVGGTCSSTTTIVAIAE